MNSPPDPVESARRELYLRRRFPRGDTPIVIACLIREDDWRPLEAPWWRGKEVCIIGADLGGNFLLRHCDGTVRYWIHRTQTDEVLASSVRAFTAQLVE
jgi:hypothetical protein